jgi:hypothetical protein
MTLAIIGIAFVPLLRMYMTAMETADALDELTTARQLAQEGLERMKNGIPTKAHLKRLGAEVWDPPLTEPARVLNHRSWRIRRRLELHRDPLEVRVAVLKESTRRGVRTLDTEPVLELVTAVEDFDWSVVE